MEKYNEQQISFFYDCIRTAKNKAKRLQNEINIAIEKNQSIDLLQEKLQSELDREIKYKLLLNN